MYKAAILSRSNAGLNAAQLDGAKPLNSRAFLPPAPALLEAIPDLPLPIYLSGESACPPEDVGGPHGY
jgi:hypothetical protein